jgi:hypothetical protein
MVGAELWFKEGEKGVCVRRVWACVSVLVVGWWKRQLSEQWNGEDIGRSSDVGFEPGLRVCLPGF